MQRTTLVFVLSLPATACSPDRLSVQSWQIALDREAGTLDIEHDTSGAVREIRLGTGTGSYELEQAFGSYRFDEVEHDLVWVEGLGKLQESEPGTWSVEAYDRDGELLGTIRLQDPDSSGLPLDWTPADAAASRAVLQAACDPEDHFLGLGGHAMDVDHVGQAFPLWVHEPGVGKASDEDYPDDWSLTGTRHASSYPVPLLLRPQHPHAISFPEASGRMEVDLCASDPDRFSVLSWEPELHALISHGDTPLMALGNATAAGGSIEQPPPWALGAWVDAVGGSERVREVAALVREAGASVSAIWTEDWKGFELQTTGYRLSNEWFLDRELYPDAEQIDTELEAAGFKWLAYFSAFVAEDTVTWDEAVAADVLIQDEDGQPYTFLGVSLKQTSLVDYTHPDALDWSAAWMQDCLELGFDGWMADYGEWLPTDAVLHDGDAMLEHNRYPERWQAANLAAIEGRNASFFSRSGWTGTQGLSPVVWGGDQRTSFDTDDGFPTVLALGLGLAASGVPIYTHDIAGYNSVGNDPSDKELWFRWAGLGAYSPVMRTHHGAFDEENHQFDRDEETLAHYAALTREHTRLYPYRSGLAREASRSGAPMIRPVAFHYGGDWGRMDAWLLGEALLVAPVLERGAAGREVTLPEEVGWYDWHSLQPATSGWQEAALEFTPVFAAAGTTVPTFATIPDTLAEADDEGLLDLEDVDGERVVYLFGGGGPFEEGDGTRYAPSGSPQGAGKASATLTSGVIDVAGVSLSIEGEIERSYTVVVVD
jgi:alpha-glucosidase